MAWIRACSVSDLEEGEAFRVDSTPPIAVYNVDGEYYATDDTCTHDQSSLADGYIDGDQVECAWHFAKFCVKTGEVLCLPATRSLRTYEVKVDAGEVLVNAPD
jgi:nitrite reductase/ring-hydroxylating ferredoxin subunit